MKKFISSFKIFLLLFLSSISISQAANPKLSNNAEFLPADQAFYLNENLEDNELTLVWDIADGYYLYKHKISLVADGNNLIDLTLPTAIEHNDPFWGDTLIYRDNLILTIPSQQLETYSKLLVNYQGCADDGLCYPEQVLSIDLTKLNKSAIQQYDYLTILFFFIMGLALAFTPCILPMLPLLTASVLGSKQQLTTVKAFSLSFAYVQGMAFTYAILGILIVSAGAYIQSFLQSPLMLITISIGLIILSCSMFGWYEIALPSSWQTKLASLGNTNKSRGYLNIFILGAISGLVVSPCTSAPLASILLWVTQSGDIYLGAMALYLLALGMGMPLLLVTILGNKILPKSGDWLFKIKPILGFALLSLPILLISRLLPNGWDNILLMLLFISFLIWLLFQIPFSGLGKVLKLGLTLSIVACLYPLTTWITTNDLVANKVQVAKPNNIQVFELDELKSVLQNSEQVIMLDIFAEWCVQCKILEQEVLQDDKIKQELQNMLVVKIDATNNSKANQKLLAYLNIVGFPTLVFYDKQGKEIIESRMHGTIKSEDFVREIRKIQRLI